MAEVADGAYDETARPFDFLEEGVMSAIVCENDPESRARVLGALKTLGCSITQAPSARDVLKRMRFHAFDLVVLNEHFDAADPDRNSVLRYLDRMPMATRRHLFLVLISNRFRTMDPMVAFNKSVNLVVNTKDLGALEKILKRGLSDNENFYRPFKEGLARIGKT
jgi:CheY-like chemotaxis protein